MANRFNIEVTETGTGRTRDEIVRLLQEVKTQASEASRTLNNLKNQSIGAREATAAHTKTLNDLKTRLAENRVQLNDVNKQLGLHQKEYRSAEKTIASYEKQINKNSDALAKLATTGQSQSNQAKKLVQDNQRLGQAINATTGTMEKHFNAIGSLSKQQAYLTTGQKTLVNSLINEKAVHNDLVQSQNAVNTSKQKAQQTSANLEGQIKKLNAENRQLEKQLKQSQRETDKLTASQIALANVVGNTVYNAFRDLLSIGKEFITDATIYAARTDEMRLAMLNMSKQSGVARGELIAQSEAMRRMNITTQETYSTLTKFQLAQLDVTKASELARVAQDLAVVAGVETGEEVNRLTHGITTLQIRVLRTAGVFVSLEQSLKEAAIAQGRSTESFSEAEKQQILLNKVLEVGKRATGNYETALDNAGKRMRSMTRIFQDMQNAVGGLLQGPFGSLVDTLSLLMTVVTKAPAVFAALVLVLIAFGIQLVKNIAVMSGYEGRLINIIKLLLDATKATVGLTAAQTQLATSNTAVSTTATAGAASLGSMVKSLGGILALAGKIAAVLFIINTALATLAEVGKAVGATTKFAEAEAEAFRLTKEEVIELRKEYEHYLAIVKEQREKGLTNEYGRGQGFAGAGARVISNITFGYLKSPEDVFKETQRLKDLLEANDSTFKKEQDDIGLLAALQREYVDQVGKAGKANLDFKGTSEIIGFRLDRLKKQFEALAGPIDKDTGLVLTMAERLNVLKPEILDLDTTFQQIAISQEDYNRLIAEAEQRFPGFIEMLRVLRGEGQKYIEGIGEAEAEAARRLIDVQRRLRSSIREIYGLFGQGDAQTIKTGSLELLEKRLQIVRQEIDDINELRINLNRDVGQPIPQDREARLSLQNTYETAVKVRDEIRAAQRANRDFIAEVVKAQQLASNARTTAIKAELIAAKLIADNQVKRIQDEKQLTAEVVALTKQRAEAAKDEAGTQRTAFAQFYKEQLENLIKSEDATRRLNAQLAFMSGQAMPGLNVPEFGLGGVTTALENIAIPAATQAENVATITQSVQNIEKAVTSQTMTTDVMGVGGLSSGTINLVNPGGKGFPLLTGDVVSAAKRYGIDPNLLVNLAYRESGIRQYDDRGQVITSSAGAMGVMQLMPGTAARYGADPSKTAQNIDAGARYLADLLKMFGGKVDLALAGYNAGEFVKKASNGGTIAQREARLRSLIAKNSDVRDYVTGITGSSPQSLYEIPTSPKLPKGSDGTAFPQTGSQLINNLTPSQIIAATRLSRARQRILTRQIQQSYVGSPQAEFDFGTFETETGANELEQFKKNQSEIRLINERTKKDFYNSEQYKQQLFTNTELARKRAAIVTHDVITQLNEDEKNNYRESAEYKTKVIEEAEIRVREAYNSSRDTLVAAQADVRARSQFHEKYLSTIHNNAEALRIKASQDAEDRYNLMIEETNSNWRESLDYRLMQYRNFEVNRYETTKQLENEIAEITSQIEHALDFEPLQVEETRLRTILEISKADTAAKMSMTENAIRLSDAQIYHADRANAKILEYLAEQRSVDQIVADARINTLEKIFSGIESGIGKITSKLGFFGDVIKDIIGGLARIALSKVFLTLFGLSPSPTTAQPNAQGSISNILGGLLGGFGGVYQRAVGGLSGTPAVGTPPFVPNLTNLLFSGAAGTGITNGQQGTQQAISAIFGKLGVNDGLSIPVAVPTERVGGTWGDFGKALGFPTIAKNSGGGLLSGALNAFGPILPFAGVGIGAQLGGSSKAGSILGAAGGGILGLAGAALLGSSYAASALGTIGTLGGLLGFALPVLPIAGALLVGAYFLNRNKKRRENEKQRTVFMNDALGQLNSLLSQVRRDKIGGDEALAQAAQIRTQYMSQAQALNDSKTRNIAIKDVSRLDVVINQIKTAAKAQERRKELDLALVPEFAGGARIVPGPLGAGDIVPALLSPGEMVLNYAQQQAVGFNNLAKANVPSYTANGRYANGGIAVPYRNGTLSGNTGEMNIYIVADKKFAEDLAVEGRDKIVEISSSDVRNKGKLYSSIRNI